MRNMKLRYFLRGLGIGVLVTAMVLMISYQSQDKLQILTNKEIIERAEALGMVLPEESTAPAPSESVEPENSQQPAETQGPSAEVSASPDIAPSATPTPEATPIATPTPEVSPSATPESPEKKPVEEKPVYISVSIEKGMWSESVSRVLQEAGLVENASRFNQYLTDNGYASYLSVGTYNIPKGATYHEIAEMITSN